MAEKPARRARKTRFDKELDARLPLTQLLKMRLEERVVDPLDPRREVTVKEIVVDRLVEAAMRGEPWAVKELWDRAEGGPLQNLAIDGVQVPTSIAELIHLGCRSGGNDIRDNKQRLPYVQDD